MLKPLIDIKKRRKKERENKSKKDKSKSEKEGAKVPKGNTLYKSYLFLNSTSCLVLINQSVYFSVKVILGFQMSPFRQE